MAIKIGIMQRREAVRNLLFGVPGGIVLGSLLSGCKRDEIPGEVSFKGEVIIAGAGLSGLYAASLLGKYNIPYRILEASSRVGGRIKSVDAFGAGPVETGAQRVRGQRSIFMDLVNQHSIQPLVKNNLNSYFLYENQMRDEFYMRTSADLAGRGETLFQLIDSMGSYPGNNKSFTQYLSDFPVSHALFDVANSLVGNRFGADNDSLGMIAIKESESARTAGNSYFIQPSGSFQDILFAAFPAEISKTEFNQNVVAIDYSGNRIEVSTGSGDSYLCDAVLITVPLSILKSGEIGFQPALPADKQMAIENIGFGNSIVIALKFNSPFWKEDAAHILGGSVCPEYIVSNAGKANGDYVLTAVMNGYAAEQMVTLNNSDRITALIAELSSMFPGIGVSGLFTGQSIVQDWSQDQFIRGGVSYNSLDSAGKRAALAAAVQDKLFFAGEACNANGHAGTLHGAMESSYSAVLNLLKS